MRECSTLVWLFSAGDPSSAGYNLCSHVLRPFSEKVFHALAGVVTNQRALESTTPDASNGGSNFEIQPLGADLMSFEVARLPQNWQKISPENSELFGAPATSNVTKSVPSGRILVFDPSLNLPGLGLSTALRVRAVRHL